MSAPGPAQPAADGARPDLRVVRDLPDAAGCPRAEPEPAGMPLTALERLLALLAGQPMHLTEVDLLAIANQPYDGLGHDVPLTARPAAQLAVDFFLTAAADDRSAGGKRTKDVAYELCRYLLPFMLEHRESAAGPLAAGQLDVRDVRQLRNMLAGEHLLPAATVASAHLGRRRLAITCHWITLTEAESVTGCTADQLAEQVDSGALPVQYDRTGVALVRAVDLRRAGLLRELDTPHGLKASSAHTCCRCCCSSGSTPTTRECTCPASRARSGSRRR